jgi:hypothetical protein
MKRLALGIALATTISAGTIQGSATEGENQSATQVVIPAAEPCTVASPCNWLAALNQTRLQPAGGGPENSSAAKPHSGQNKKPRFSPAGKLNSHLPDWLRFDGEYRARLEEGLSGQSKPFGDDGRDTYFLNRIRVGATIKPARWLKFHFEGQDSRAFEKNPPKTSTYFDQFDLRQAYVEIGNPEKAILSLTVGRQLFYWGEGRLVADSRWSFPGRSFDAARITFRYRGYRLDSFAASVVQITPAVNSGFSEPRFGNNIHGLYGGIEKLVPNAVIEPYVFWRTGARVIGEDKKLGNLSFKAAGFRWNGKLPGGFDYATELAIEKGKVGNSDFSAWAGHWVLGHTWDRKWKPRVYAEYNYAKGDENPKDNRVQTFDVIYPSAHLKWGETDQVGWRNIHDVRGSLEAAPGKNWTASANYHAYWLADVHDGLYAANGSVVAARVPSGSAGRWVGQEIDLQSSYKLPCGIEAGAGVGHIFPGTFIKQVSAGNGYTYPYVVMIYTF